jgi:DhnA family fructose-bisphosphate aldolase class Ia
MAGGTVTGKTHLSISITANVVRAGARGVNLGRDRGSLLCAV